MSIFLFGDSHGRILSRAAAQIGLKMAGGFIASGRTLNDAVFHDLVEGDVRFRDADTQSTYRAMLDAAGKSSLAALNQPVLCLFGMNLHYLARDEVWNGFAATPDAPGQFLSRDVMHATLRAQIAGALAFYYDLTALGLPVFSALPPRRTEDTGLGTRADIFRVLEDMAMTEITAAGATVIDHRSWSLGPDDKLRSEYAAEGDQVHGSLSFGCRLLKEALPLLSVSQRATHDDPEALDQGPDASTTSPR